MTWPRSLDPFSQPLYERRKMIAFLSCRRGNSSTGTEVNVFPACAQRRHRASGFRSSTSRLWGRSGETRCAGRRGHVSLGVGVRYTDQGGEEEEDHESEEQLQHRILTAALDFVPAHGWTAEAIAEGAQVCVGQGAQPDRDQPEQTASRRRAPHRYRILRGEVVFSPIG